MKVLPLSFLGSLTEGELLKHECSDRIWVGRSVFERFTTSGDSGTTAIVMLTNRVGQSVPVVIHNIHYDDEDIIYAPAWITAELLHDTDDVHCERYMPSLGTRITVLPHTSDHLRTGTDPETILRDGFEQYTCLIRGLDYQIWLGEYSFTITLTDLNPSTEDIICIRGNELELDLLAPLDRPATPTQTILPHESVLEPATALPPALETIPQSEEERRTIIADAARRRLAALRQE